MAEQKLKNTIGVIVPSLTLHSCDILLNTLSISFKEKGFGMIVVISDHSIERECELYTFLKTRVDCILTFSIASDYDQIKKYVPKKKPVIFLFNKPEGCTRTSILESDYSAVYQGLISCRNRNATKIAFVCSHRMLSSVKDCLHAYENAMNTTPEGFDPNLIIDADELDVIDGRAIVHRALSLGCSAIFSATQQLTSHIVDYLTFYNFTPGSTPIILFGYGNMGQLLTSQLNIDLIVPPFAQIAQLTLQQSLYLIHHPDYKEEREFLLKGTLQMHKYNGLNIND